LTAQRVRHVRSGRRALRFCRQELGKKALARGLQKSVRMAIRSLLVATDPGERMRRSVMYVLSRDPRLTVGHRFGNYVPVVTIPLSPDEGADLTEQLRQVPGVRDVSVVAVSEELELPRAPRPQKRRRA
jgi:hypothetical protein